eukprot:5618067-Prymnesium_polylepis.1
MQSAFAPTRILRQPTGYNLQSVLPAEIYFRLVRKLSSEARSQLPSARPQLPSARPQLALS